MTIRRADLAAGALSLLAVAASLATAREVFEELPHVEDEFANLWQASVMAEGKIALPSPPEPPSFLVPFVVDHRGLRFGKYLPGWPATLALGVATGAPYAVNPILAGVAVWLTYRLGTRLAGVAAGLLAALLAGASPMVRMLSGTLMSHMLSVELTLAFSLGWFELFGRGGDGVEARRVPRGVLAAAAGLSLGLLVLTRPLTALGVALPFVLHGVWLLARRRGEVARDLARVAALALAVAALWPTWQWAQTGDPWRNLYTLWWPYDRVGFGPGIGVLESGHTLGQAWINTRHSLAAWRHDLFGWPFVSWIFLPFGMWALRRRSEAWVAAAVFPSLIVVYLAYWVGSWLLGPRYFVEAVPALAAVSAGGIVWLAGPAPARGRRIAIASLVVGLLLIDLAGYLPARLGGLRGLFGITRASLEAFQRVDPGAAVVVVRRNPAWHGYGNLLTLTAPFRESALLLVYERGPEIDAAVVGLYPDLAAFVYDPAQPGRLERWRRDG